MYKALIIDDEEMSRLNLAQLLRIEFPEMELSLAGSAKEAQLLLNANNTDFDLLFLDIQMPHQTGLEFLSELRKTNNGIHVIFVTAYDDSNYIIQAMRLKAIDYLTKPVKINELRDAVEQFIQLNKKSNLDEIEELLFPKKKIQLPVNEGYRFVNTNEIVYFTANGRRSSVKYSNNSDEVVHTSLQTLENMLDENFIRAGRKYIINKNLIYLINSKTNTIHVQMDDNMLLGLKMTDDAIKKLLL